MVRSYMSENIPRAAEAALAEMKIAYGLVLELHGCEGADCTEQSYLQDARRMMQQVAQQAETISQLTVALEKVREDCFDDSCWAKTIDSALAKAMSAAAPSNYDRTREAAQASVPTTPENSKDSVTDTFGCQACANPGLYRKPGFLFEHSRACKKRQAAQAGSGTTQGFSARAEDQGE
jgi:hypothetical protein